MSLLVFFSFCGVVFAEEFKSKYPSRMNYGACQQVRKRVDFFFFFGKQKSGHLTFGFWSA